MPMTATLQPRNRLGTVVVLAGILVTAVNAGSTSRPLRSGFFEWCFHGPTRRTEEPSLTTPDAESSSSVFDSKYRGGDVEGLRSTASEPLLRPTTSGVAYGNTFRSAAADTYAHNYEVPPTASSAKGGSSSSSTPSWSSYPRKASWNPKRTNNHHQHQQHHHSGFWKPPQKTNLFQPVTDFWKQRIQPTVKSWPKIQCRVEPTTTLKIRKTFRPLHTIVQLGADFNTQLGVWQFRSSWEDALIGGKLTLAGRELQFTKSWQLSVGAMEDLVTRLRLRAAVDLQTYKAYARVGFRTERLAPINIMEGFTVLKQIPLDGHKNGHVKLQVKANFALPEPEIEYSTETQQSCLIGMGDIEINIEELNLLLDY